MSDYELCKMLHESGDPSETIKYIGKSYLEGKDVTTYAEDMLIQAIGMAELDAKIHGGSFLPRCLENLEKDKNLIFKQKK